MRRHFATQGLTKVIWSTKIAIQEKEFRDQAGTELQVAKAKQIATEQGSLGAHTCITDCGGTSMDAESSKVAVWELSSTQLWQYYEGGSSRNQSGWIPGGYHRIQVTHFTAQHRIPVVNVILESGDRTFLAEGVSVPRGEKP